MSTSSSARLRARFATDDERADWDALIAANPGGGEVWQGAEYLDVKQREGRYLTRHVIVEGTTAFAYESQPGRGCVAFGVLAKRVPGLGEWWHVPAGPTAGSGEQSPEDPAADTLAMTAAIAELAKRNGAFLLKVEPRLGPDARAAFHAAGYRDTVRVIPNPSTIIVDVSGSEDDVFKRLGKKARNSINRARRDGIVVERAEASEENCAALFRLLQETAEGRFVLRAERYYREFWQTFSRTGHGQIFLAHRDVEGAPRTLVSGAFAMILGEKSTYKDGASVRAKTAYGASHAVQWEVIRWANEHGASTHDLCGAPPAAQADDTEHPLHGVGRFKRSFQPEITDYAGAFDLPLSGAKYAFWTKLGDRLARRASLALTKDPYY